jgi:hypothetical protein
VTSVALPAVTGTMMRTGFDGQVSADADAMLRNRKANASQPRRMASSPMWSDPGCAARFVQRGARA